MAAIEHELNDYTLTFEYAHSKEEDYRSNALTAKVSREFNQKNTTVTAGVSHAFDKVLATDFTNIFEDEGKDTLDFSVGVSQILSRNTIFDFNFGYGYTEGYLADPYRRISQIQSFVIDTPFGPFPVMDTFDYAENRPDELHRFVAKASVRHYFQRADAALKASYRFYANIDRLEGHTFALKWIQQITPQVSATPYVRYYQQSSADYYYSTLTDSGINGSELNDGTSPHYSSDYRLSAFDAFTYGVRLAWEVRPELTLDLQLERYEMTGRDSETPDIFFPSANVVSVGVQWNF